MRSSPDVVDAAAGADGLTNADTDRSTGIAIRDSPARVRLPSESKPILHKARQALLRLPPAKIIDGNYVAA